LLLQNADNEPDGAELLSVLTGGLDVVIDRLLVHLLFAQQDVEEVLLVRLHQVEPVAQLVELLFREVRLMLVFQVY
jgi:hypothetical protein